MISVFDFQNYRKFLMAWIDSQNERGTSGRLASAMNMSPSMMSLILKGEKNLSQEQATELVEYLGLNDIETDYFFVILEVDKSGSHKLTQRLLRKKETILKQASKISTRINKDLELSDEQKSIYYSTWLYTGVRNLSACSGNQDIHKMAEHLKIPFEIIQPIVEFLVENKICNLEKGQLSNGPQNTHLGNDSPYVNQQHRNWRVKGFEQMELRRETDLFYTCPMSLSQEAYEHVRKILPNVIQQILKIVGPSSSEKVACLNFDFFEW